jgi:predicted DNA-binding transcriptional regulator AlpA
MDFLSIEDVLKKLNISKSYLATLRKHDESFPKCIRLSKRRNIVFMKEEIENWMTNKFYKQLDLFNNHQLEI